ncbi:HAD family hydrolase [Halobacillus sp. B23F22_1]|uniref:HAD family hydrolase n=1 Tax=Halobacillus sp. B23F22_1 TaxID=3459514 RepID=UPI00373F21D5
MIKAVLFDLDGTLLDRDQSLIAFAKSQYRKYRQLCHIGEKKYINRLVELDEKGYVPKEVVYPKLVEELHIRGLRAEELIKDYFSYFHESCIAFPNVNKVLKGLKESDFQLGIITNGRDPFQLDNLQALKIDHYFDVILISEKERLKKPDPQIFHRALKQLNARAEDSLFVGDHPENDVKAAIQAGMQGVWKKEDYWGNVKVEHSIGKIEELPVMIEQTF